MLSKRVVFFGRCPTFGSGWTEAHQPLNRQCTAPLISCVQVHACGPAPYSRCFFFSRPIAPADRFPPQQATPAPQHLCLPYRPPSAFAIWSLPTICHLSCLLLFFSTSPGVVLTHPAREDTILAIFASSAFTLTITYVTSLLSSKPDPASPISTLPLCFRVPKKSAQPAANVSRERVPSLTEPLCLFAELILSPARSPSSSSAAPWTTTDRRPSLRPFPNYKRVTLVQVRQNVWRGVVIPFCGVDKCRQPVPPSFLHHHVQ